MEYIGPAFPPRPSARVNWVTPWKPDGGMELYDASLWPSDGPVHFMVGDGRTYTGYCSRASVDEKKRQIYGCAAGLEFVSSSGRVISWNQLERWAYVPLALLPGRCVHGGYDCECSEPKPIPLITTMEAEASAQAPLYPSGTITGAHLAAGISFDMKPDGERDTWPSLTVSGPADAPASSGFELVAGPSFELAKNGEWRQVDPEATDMPVDVDGVVDRMIEQSRHAGAFDPDPEEEGEEDQDVAVVFHEPVEFESPSGVQSFPMLQLLRAPEMDGLFIANIFPSYVEGQKVRCNAGQALLQFDLNRSNKEAGQCWRAIRVYGWDDSVMTKRDIYVLEDWSHRPLRYTVNIQDTIFFQRIDQ